MIYFTEYAHLKQLFATTASQHQNRHILSLCTTTLHIRLGLGLFNANLVAVYILAI